MTPAPEVGVIMTVRDGARYVAEAVESVQRQSRADFDLVIVNDGSTDDTMAALAPFASDPRISIIDSQPMGRVAALNRAWATVTGDVIANLDADDLAHEDRLRAQADLLGDQPEVGLVGSAVRFVDTESDAEHVVRPPTDDADLRRALARANPFVHSSVMVRRRAAEEVGGYDPRWPFNHDYALWVAVAERHRVATVPDVLATKRQGPHAYFANRMSASWTLATGRIRWRAWRRLSRRAADLPYALRPIPQAMSVAVRNAARRR